jgi:RHS repeat-associated protein
MGTWSMANGYDTLNRLTAASATSGPYSGLQISWGLDPFGNRTSETFSGSSGVSVPTNSTAYYNAGNRISSTSLGIVQYDSSGDVMQDNQNQYLYDGEGRLCAVKNLIFGAMTGYVYGADGTRVSTGTISTWGSCDPAANGYQATKDSILGPAGGQLTETGIDASGKVVWANTNVWAGGQLIATYDPNGLHFYLSDWNGSRRVQTDYAGVVERSCTNLPYGNGLSCDPSPTEDLYAGLQRDSESGLDHAMFRQYASTFGRWITPDPYDGSYDWSNPQSLNRYAYVYGRPMRMRDPSGLSPIPCPSGLPTSGVDPVTGLSVLIMYACDNGITRSAMFGAAAADALRGLAGVLGYAIPIVNLGLEIYEVGKELGLWNQKPKFHGNVQASQSGKNVPNNNFTKQYLPSNAQTCSAMLQFYAPPNFDLQAIVNAGYSDGLLGANGAVGQYGTFDFQRVVDSAGNTTFYSGYTPVANIAVGAYLYGAGVPRDATSLISDTYAFFKSANGATAQQAEYRTLGWDLGKAGWSPSCASF